MTKINANNAIDNCKHVEKGVPLKCKRELCTRNFGPTLSRQGCPKCRGKVKNQDNDYGLDSTVGSSTGRESKNGSHRKRGHGKETSLIGRAKMAIVNYAAKNAGKSPLKEKHSPKASVKVCHERIKGMEDDLAKHKTSRPSQAEQMSQEKTGPAGKTKPQNEHDRRTPLSFPHEEDRRNPQNPTPNLELNERQQPAVDGRPPSTSSRDKSPNPTPPLGEFFHFRRPESFQTDYESGFDVGVTPDRSRTQSPHTSFEPNQPGHLPREAPNARVGSTTRPRRRRHHKNVGTGMRIATPPPSEPKVVSVEDFAPAWLGTVPTGKSVKPRRLRSGRWSREKSQLTTPLPLSGNAINEDGPPLPLDTGAKSQSYPDDGDHGQESPYHDNTDKNDNLSFKETQSERMNDGWGDVDSVSERSDVRSDVDPGGEGRIDGPDDEDSAYGGSNDDPDGFADDYGDDDADAWLVFLCILHIIPLIAVL